MGRRCATCSRLSHALKSVAHFYIIMNFRFEFDGSFPCLSFVFNRFLVNNMRESLWKWAQEVSIKRLINVKSKAMAVNYIRFHSKECYRNSFMVKSMNILCSLSRKYQISSYILCIHDGEEFFAVSSLFIYYAHEIW